MLKRTLRATDSAAETSGICGEGFFPKLREVPSFDFCEALAFQHTFSDGR